jgi:hypothetical protein
VKRSRLTLGTPAEALEEADIRQLHVRDHPLPAEQPARPDGEPHQLGAQMVLPMRDRHGQAIAFPMASRRVERIQADGAARLLVDAADRVQRPSVGIASVAIMTGEEPLFIDEHRVSQAKVRVELGL